MIESVNLLANANGNVLRSEIVGSIKMRCFLSGMPELRLGLNDKVLFESTGRGRSKSLEFEVTICTFALVEQTFLRTLNSINACVYLVSTTTERLVSFRLMVNSN